MMNLLFGRKKSTLFILSYFIVVISALFYVNIEYLNIQKVLGSSNSVKLDTDSHLAKEGGPNSFEPIPTNISVSVEPKDTGTLYLSALVSDGKIELTRELNDELFPFQTTNWYQLITLSPNYFKTVNNTALEFDNLIVGKLDDFDNFDDLLSQARLYSDVPVNRTFILDLPHKDVSFMQLQIPFPNGTSGIYYGLFDGNQKGDRSDINLHLNPQSTLKILDSDSAIDVQTNEQLYNVTKTLACNDLYKLGYEKCQ